MTRGVRNTVSKARAMSKRSAATVRPASNAARKRRPAVLMTADVLVCLTAVHRRTDPLVKRFSELQLAIALSVLASRRLRQACERGDCSGKYRNQVCEQFCENARTAAAGSSKLRSNRTSRRKARRV